MKSVLKNIYINLTTTSAANLLNLNGVKEEKVGLTQRFNQLQHNTTNMKISFDAKNSFYLKVRYDDGQLPRTIDKSISCHHLEHMELLPNVTQLRSLYIEKQSRPSAGGTGNLRNSSI